MGLVGGAGKNIFADFTGATSESSQGKAQQFEACREKGSEGDHELENGLVSGLIRMGAAQTSSVIYRLHSSHRDDFSFFRTFGCRVHARPPGGPDAKFDPRSRKGMFLGFPKVAIQPLQQRIDVKINHILGS